MEILRYPFPFALALILPHYLSHVQALFEARHVSFLVCSSFFALWSFSFTWISIACVMMLLHCDATTEISDDVFVGILVDAASMTPAKIFSLNIRIDSSGVRAFVGNFYNFFTIAVFKLLGQQSVKSGRDANFYNKYEFLTPSLAQIMFINFISITRFGQSFLINASFHVFQ